MRINATIALITLTSVAFWLLPFVDTDRSVSADFHRPTEIQSLHGTAEPSENLAECVPFTRGCTAPNPDDRRRGIGYWLLYGVWMAIRWVAMFVWGFWAWVLAVVGGMVVLFVPTWLLPKVFEFFRKSESPSTPPRAMAIINDDLEPYQQRAEEQLGSRVHYQRDDMEQEQKRQLQEFRRQQEERQRDWEQRRDQLRAEQAANAPLIAAGQTDGTIAPPSGDTSVPISAEPAQPAALVPGTTARGRSRKAFLVTLVISVLMLVIVGGIGTLVAFVAFNAPREAPAAASIEPTPDLEATIAAAVAMIPALLTPSPVAELPLNNPSGAAPTAAAPTSTSQLPIPLGVGPSPPGLPSDRLPTVECPSCITPDQPGSGYVEWIREPKVSESGVMAFRARIDKRANFVVAGADCGFENLTLTDDNGDFYGAIIPHGMANACGSFPGDRTAETYQYIGDLLTVRLLIDPVAALHPGLQLCLWSGGMTQELLDCVPVKQQANVDGDPSAGRGSGTDEAAASPGDATPVFPLYDSQAANTVRSSAENSSTVACDVRMSGDTMLASAHWSTFPVQDDGQALSGYRYAWLIPDNGGGVEKVEQDLSADHQGTSLFDKALPPGRTLSFVLTPLYGDGSRDGTAVRVDCDRVG